MSTLEIPTVEEQVYARISCGYYSCITVALIESKAGRPVVGRSCRSADKAEREAREIATQLAVPYLFHIRSNDGVEK